MLDESIKNKTDSIKQITSTLVVVHIERSAVTVDQGCSRWCTCELQISAIDARVSSVTAGTTTYNDNNNVTVSDRNGSLGIFTTIAISLAYRSGRAAPRKEKICPDAAARAAVNRDNGETETAIFSGQIENFPERVRFPCGLSAPEGKRGKDITAATDLSHERSSRGETSGALG